MNKNLVLALICSTELDQSEKFNKLFDLYRNHPNTNTGYVAMYNKKGFSERTLSDLIYEVKKIYSITDVDIALYEPSPEVKSEDKTDTFLKDISVADPKVIVGNSTDKKEDYVYEDGIGSDLKKVNLREDFPFLNQADCPQEFHTAVGVMISAWYRHKEAHEKLLKISQKEIQATPDEITALTKESLESFAENRAIWETLTQYQATGKILNIHNLFERLFRFQELDEKTPQEMHTFLNSAKAFFTKKKKELEANPDRKEAIQKAVALRQEEVNYITAKMNKQGE